jgi:CRP-like cAMP-binding protein
MLLRHVWLFSECTEDELRGIVAATRTRAVPAGGIVIREGEFGTSCFVVAAGQALVERGAQILGSDNRPAVIGAVALAGLPHRASVTAMTDMLLLEFDRETYERLRRDGSLRSVAHRLDVIVAEQRRLASQAPVGVRVPSAIL